MLRGRPDHGTTGHLQSGVCRVQAPVDTSAHSVYFQLVQDDMNKSHSVDKDWEFVSKGTEISLGRFVSEHFTPLTLDTKTGVVSGEDTEEIWESVKEVVIEKVRRNKTGLQEGTRP